MKKHAKILKKILLLSGISLLILLFCIYLFAEYSGYFLFDKEYRNKVVQNIKDSPQLPARIYHIYNKVHPNSLQGKPWDYYCRRIFNLNPNECPYRLAAYSAGYIGKEHIPASFHLKHFVKPEQALNFVLDKSWFGNGIYGITNASGEYFQKKLPDLNDREMIELILLSSNAALYDKRRFPDRVNEKIEKIILQLENH